MPQERPNGHRIKQLHILARQRMGGTLGAAGTDARPSPMSCTTWWSTGPNAQAPGMWENFSPRTHPTVSGILSRLEAKGLRIIPDGPGDDRRCKRIHVSEKALTCDGQIHDYIEALEKQMVQDFTPEEQAQFSSLLDRAIQNLGGEPGVFHKLHKKRRMPIYDSTAFPEHPGIQDVCHIGPPHDGWGGGHGSPDPHPHGGIYGQRRKNL